MSRLRRIALALVVGGLLVLAPSTVDAAPRAGGSPAPGSVAVIGDFGADSPEEAAVAALVRSARPAAIVTVGDNVYDDADFARRVGAYYGPWVSSGRMLPALGNHDLAEGVAAFDRYFPYLAGRHVYSAGRGGIRFFVIDSTTALADAASLARQRSWLRSALMASKARWKVVVMHHPPYSSGQAHGSSAELRWPFRAWGADLVLAGHEHNYERLEAGGLTYVVDGAGGQRLYGLGPLLPESKAHDDEHPGALFLRASADELVGEYWTADRTRVDSFAIPSM